MAQEFKSFEFFLRQPQDYFGESPGHQVLDSRTYNYVRRCIYVQRNKDLRIGIENLEMEKILFCQLDVFFSTWF